jgi:hypothetical protein
MPDGIWQIVGFTMCQIGICGFRAAEIAHKPSAFCAGAARPREGMTIALIHAERACAMNHSFSKRVHSAAIAGWWTLLIGVGFVTVIWFAFLGLMSARPGWLLPLYGPEMTWSTIETAALWLVGVFKLCLWLMALFVTWLTLWAHRLQKDEGAP